MTDDLFGVPEWDNETPDNAIEFSKEISVKRQKNKRQKKNNSKETTDEQEQNKSLIQKNRVTGVRTQPNNESTTQTEQRPTNYVTLKGKNQKKKIQPVPDKKIECDNSIKSNRKRKHNDERAAVGSSAPVTTNKSDGTVDEEMNQPLLKKKLKKNTIEGKLEAISTKKPGDNKKELQKTNNMQLAFKEKLMENLKGSRFRFINEQLYTMKGTDAVKLFKNEPDSFDAYHEGFRHQVEQWPLNPLKRLIKSIKKMPKTHQIVDFGCGDAELADSVGQKVYSIDLVSKNPKVIACDMANTPLDSASMNVAVFCLSLMGTNLQDFLLEANRVLKIGGILKIAEVESRFDNVQQFISNTGRCGFELVHKDVTNNLFYFMDFKKTRNVSKCDKMVPKFSLKPCLYKKR